MASGNGAQYLKTGGEGTVPQWHGMYYGYIAVNQDPLAQGRVKLRIPQVFGNTTSGWASPMVPITFVPKVGTPVTASFVGGDPTQPVWFGNFALPAPGTSVTTGTAPPPANPSPVPAVGAIYYQVNTSGTILGMFEWNGTGWVDYFIGSNAIAPGTIVPGIVNGTVISGAVFDIYNASNQTVGALDSTVGSNSSGISFGNSTPGVSISGRGTDLIVYMDMLGGLTGADPGGPLTPQINMYALGQMASGAQGIQLNVVGGINAVTGTPGNLAPETWHPVTVPSGWGGTIRVKILPLNNFACLDINVSIPSPAPTNGAGFTAGSLWAAGYYPKSTRQYDLSVNGQYTTTSNASPRVSIPAASSGGPITIDMPGFASTAAVGFVSGTIMYPLD